MVDRDRRNLTPAERRQAEYERQQREEQERIAQERADREALEVERLRQLRDAQISPSDYHGYDLPDYRYSGTDYSFQPEPTYYRPPTGWNYETDTPEITYYEMFGEPSLADIDRVNAELDELLTSQAWSQAERQQIEDTRASFLAGEISPHSMNVQNMYAEFNIKERGEFADKIADAGYEGYSLQATNLAEAKAQADEVYMGVLKNAYEENPNDKLKKAIEQGPLDFDKIEDVKLYESLSEDSIQKQAFDAQGAVVEDYLNRTDNRVFDTRMLEQGETVSLGAAGPAQFMLNTGTIIGAPSSDADNIRFGGFGTYGNIDWNNPPEPSGFEKAVSLGLDILSIFQPQFAPLAQGSKTLIQTGDLEEAFKSAGGAYLGTKIANIGNAEITQVFDDLGIDLTTLPESVQNVVLDTTTAALEGKSGSEAFEDAVTGEALGYLGEGAEEALSNIGIEIPDFETPQALKDVGDVIVDVLEPPLEFVGETFEPVIEAGEQVLSTAEDVLEPVKEVVETVGEPIADVVDEISDALDSPIGDLLEGAISGISGIGGTAGMMAGTKKPTQVEDIFDKELFKFDTEIKSTQEMLSPMMNLRRYG